jgi:seryl-tRNA synthetase
MLQTAYLRAQRDEAIQRLAKRNLAATETIDRILALDEVRRNTQKNLDDNLAAANLMAKDIGLLFREGKTREADTLKLKTAELKEQAKELTEALESAELQLHNLLVTLPNTPYHLVKPGTSADDNEVVKTGGTTPTLHAEALPHWELAKKYDLIDFELGVKITGAGFPVYKNQGAKLQRALINFFLDHNTDAGYREVIPPHFVNEASGFGTGQLPDKEGQMYFMPADNLYAIPTAEVPVTNFYRDVILKAEELPVQLTAYTPCFRREAGSYGKDVRGLNRLHQFDKVEVVAITDPASSYAMLETMVAHVEALIQKLELPYRILRLCGGDMGFTSAMTYDFEVYSTAQQRWLEVSSVSNFETFQANRLKLRYRDAQGKTQLAHTLNGSSLALPRIVAALLENHQDAHGINIPQALIPYTKFDRIA